MLKMGIKRVNEETETVSEKKSKVDAPFSMELFLRNFKDSESSFLGKNIGIVHCIDQRRFVL